MASRRRRAKTPEEVRRHPLSVKLNDVELALVDGARERSSMSRAQWVMSAVMAELGRGPGLIEAGEREEELRDLLAARLALDRIGVNLNQAVRVLNSTGAVGDARQMQAVLDRVDVAVGRVDAAARVVEDRRGRRR